MITNTVRLLNRRTVQKNPNSQNQTQLFFENHQAPEIPNYISQNPVFQNLANPFTPFDQNYVTQNSHMLAIFSHRVQTSPYSTWEGLHKLAQNNYSPTPLPNLVKERFTSSLKRLASIQLELTQELTNLELYHILYFSTTLSNLSMHHLLLIHQLNSYVNSFLQQIIKMHVPNQSNEETMANKKDKTMEEQVVP
ncbi:hypothetical protein H5410_055720 [Solanum commersonii]|uniref:Uncharacterized protein n=1 Tax=Solanum commersonii TaxID=4109 RepID=A0A9J5WJ54_SOLCO|nr:hypothetical protein H5410_055720 [Solanum commersonii]